MPVNMLLTILLWYRLNENPTPAFEMHLLFIHSPHGITVDIHRFECYFRWITNAWKIHSDSKCVLSSVRFGWTPLCSVRSVIIYKTFISYFHAVEYLLLFLFLHCSSLYSTASPFVRHKSNTTTNNQQQQTSITVMLTFSPAHVQWDSHLHIIVIVIIIWHKYSMNEALYWFTWIHIPSPIPNGVRLIANQNQTICHAVARN